MNAEDEGRRADEDGVQEDDRSDEQREQFVKLVLNRTPSSCRHNSQKVDLSGLAPLDLANF